MPHPIPRSSLLALLLAVSAACAASPGASERVRAPSDGSRPLPSLDSATFVWNRAAGRVLGLEAWLDALAAADVAFVGETHLDDATHRVELAILEGLHARRGGKVVLSLEMFERDVQPVLDEYLAGKLSEREFLARARPWGNYASDYRPLIEFSKAHGVPVVAANAPAAVRRKLAAGGRAALDALAPEERAWLPAEILPASASYWERVDRATRGHMGFAEQPEEQRLFSGQNLWDNCMGDAVAQALARHPGHAVVHFVGGFHVMFGDGTAAQVARRAPGAELRVVELMPAGSLASARPELDAERADDLVYVESTARSVSDGLYAVAPRFELRYSLDVPAGSEVTLPLLLYLPDSGERPADARAFWSAALGDEVALAVVEPPFPERADDLAEGGRWNRSASFAADQGAVQAGLERLVEYVTRRFPVDGARVVVAGRGLGATSALSSAFSSDWLAADYVLAEPRGEGALRLEGLPDRAPATRAVTLLAEPAALEGLAWLRDDLGAIGTPAEVRALVPERSSSTQLEDELRAALGLGARPVPGGEPLLVVLERDTPRARQWAETRARQHERAGRPARVALAEDVTPDEPTERETLGFGGALQLADFGEGRGLPLSPGAFGGTTVVVLPASASADERAAWKKLEDDKVLRKRSMFAGLRVAFEDAQPGLATVLGELEAKGTRNALVVPATFCAPAVEMQALRASFDERALSLELAWLPGLGAELCDGVPAD